MVPLSNGSLVASSLAFSKNRDVLIQSLFFGHENFLVCVLTHCRKFTSSLFGL